MSTIIKLASGEWPMCEVLPTHWAAFALHGPDRPEKPYREVPIDGGVEKLDLDDDHPSMQQFYREVVVFNRESSDFELLSAFSKVSVPDDWVLPEGDALALGLIAKAPADRERKLLFIRYHIITQPGELEHVQKLADGIITGEERDAGATKFPDSSGSEEKQVGADGADSAGREQVVNPAGE